MYKVLYTDNIKIKFKLLQFFILNCFCTQYVGSVCSTLMVNMIGILWQKHIKLLSKTYYSVEVATYPYGLRIGNYASDIILV